VVGWYKQRKWAEIHKNLEIWEMGKGFYKENFDEELNKRLASKALKKVEELLVSKKYFLIVLDEVLHAVKDELLNLGEVLKVVNKRGKTHLVLTGRFDTSRMSKLLKEVDLVTECKKIKHPFDLGKKAVKGLDY